MLHGMKFSSSSSNSSSSRRSRNHIFRVQLVLVTFIHVNVQRIIIKIYQLPQGPEVSTNFRYVKETKHQIILAVSGRIHWQGRFGPNNTSLKNNWTKQQTFE